MSPRTIVNRYSFRYRDILPLIVKNSRRFCTRVIFCCLSVTEKGISFRHLPNSINLNNLILDFVVYHIFVLAHIKCRIDDTLLKTC